MDVNKIKQNKRIKRKARVRAKISGTAICPRLSVFRSNKAIYAQLIDDAAGKTLASARSGEIKAKCKKYEISAEIGKLLAAKAISQGVKKAVFDRGEYKYHGRVKALADGARSAGLEF